LALEPSVDGYYSLFEGLLRYKGRICIGAALDLQHLIMTAFHDSAMGGYSGFPMTYRRLNSLFKWAGMKLVVHTFFSLAIPTSRRNMKEHFQVVSFNHCMFHMGHGKWHQWTLLMD
jgi:hypothetical protein